MFETSRVQRRLTACLLHPPLHATYMAHFSDQSRPSPRVAKMSQGDPRSSTTNACKCWRAADGRSDVFVARDWDEKTTDDVRSKQASKQASKRSVVVLIK